MYEVKHKVKQFGWFTLACSRIDHEYSSLFIIVIGLIFMFSLWCIDWVGSLCASRVFMYFCIKSSIGTQGGVGWLWGCFKPPPPTTTTPPVVYSTGRSKAVVPVLVLLFVALWFILRGGLLYVLPCVILFLCFSVLLVLRLPRMFCLCWGFTAQSTQWGHVEHGQST